MNDFKTPDFLKRYSKNPILSPSDSPFNSKLVSNPGVVKWGKKYIMTPSYDAYDSVTNKWSKDLGVAYSEDGINFEYTKRKLFTDWLKDGIRGVYDSRLIVLEDKIYICAGLDTKNGTRVRIASTKDMENWQVHHTTTPDNRNIVLFPEKINGLYVMLERPFPMYTCGEHFDIWISYSPDLVYWGRSKLLLDTAQVPFCNLKLGPGAQPLKTEAGWLIIFHATDIDPNRKPAGENKGRVKRYMAGVMLLDLKDPSKILGIAKTPLIVPEAPYEIDGWCDNVVFPTGVILEENKEVKIYYGAADIVICLATAKLDDLIDFALSK